MDSGLIKIEAAFNRCVSRKPDPLSPEGARLLGGRFNPVSCPALYLASTPTLAVAEAQRLGSIYAARRRQPIRTFAHAESPPMRAIHLRKTVGRGWAKSSM